MASDSDDTALYFMLFLGAIAVVQWWRQRSAFTPGNPTPLFTPAAPSGVAPKILDIIAPMHVSPEGQAFIKGQEQFRLQRYPDAGGYSIYWGHRIVAGDPPINNTQAQGQQFFNNDIHKVEATLNSTITQTLSQSQFDALADLVYNIGAGNWRGSTILRMINNGNIAGAAGQFGRWIYSQGKINPNLVKRRGQEQNFFNSGTNPVA